MKILFEISKEHPSLPTDEIISCLNTIDIPYRIIEKNDYLFLIHTNKDIDLIKNLFDRLSYTYYIDELFFYCSNSIRVIKKNAKNFSIDKPGSIAVRYINKTKNINSKDIVNVIINRFTQNKKVNLLNPDNEIRVFITNKKTYVGRKIEEINRSQYERRKVQFRPFFSPVSLHPKLARALVNLSEIKKNEVLLDPFCGTGGIILEGGLIGVKVIGSDIVEKMIIGCKKTLDFFNIKNYKLLCLDIGEIKKRINSVDAIVTDFPYGKSTTTKGEEMELLYERAFKVFNEILKKDKKIVVGLSNKNYISFGEKWFTLVKVYEFFSHKNLTRYFVVYKN
jgi:tRNA (guanine10-N2)-dimethyltransferase